MINQPTWIIGWRQNVNKSKMPEDSKILTGNIHKDSVDRETLKLETTEIRNEITSINLLEMVEF